CATGELRAHYAGPLLHHTSLAESGLEPEIAKNGGQHFTDTGKRTWGHNALKVAFLARLRNLFLFFAALDACSQAAFLQPVTRVYKSLTSVYTSIPHVQHAGVLGLTLRKLHGSGDEDLSCAFEQALEASHDGRIELRKHVVEEQNARLAELRLDMRHLGELEQDGKEAPLPLRAVATGGGGAGAELEFVGVRAGERPAPPHLFRGGGDQLPLEALLDLFTGGAFRRHQR